MDIAAVCAQRFYWLPTVCFNNEKVNNTSHDAAQGREVCLIVCVYV